MTTNAALLARAARQVRLTCWLWSGVGDGRNVYWRSTARGRVAQTRSLVKARWSTAFVG